MPYKCSCGKEEEKGLAFSAHFKHYKGSDHQRIGWVDPETGEIYETRPTEGRRPKKAPGGGPQTKAVQTSIKSLEPGQTRRLVSFESKTPSPVTVDILGSAIELQDDSIYRSWLIFKDMERRGIVKHDSFSSVIEDGIGLLWNVLVVTPSLQGLKVVAKEAEHGGSAGHGEEEIGARGPAEPAAAAVG